MAGGLLASRAVPARDRAAREPAPSRRHPSELGLSAEGEEAPEDGRSGDPNQASAGGAEPTAVEWTVSGALRTARYWYLWFGIFGALFAWYCIQVHQTKFLIDAGFSATTAAWALTLVAVSGIAGLIAIGHLSDRLGREWGWIASCAGYVICYALLLVIEHVPNVILMYLMVGAQGFLGYGIAALFGSVAADLFRVRDSERSSAP